MKENKELAEKMRQAIYNIPVTMDLTMETVFPIAETCAAVATSHFADKWVRVEDALPEDVSKVFFVTDTFSVSYEGRFFESYADYSKPHFLSDTGVRFPAEQIKCWMYRNIPEPPQE